MLVLTSFIQSFHQYYQHHSYHRHPFRYNHYHHKIIYLSFIAIPLLLLQLHRTINTSNPSSHYHHQKQSSSQLLPFFVSSFVLQSSSKINKHRNLFTTFITNNRINKHDNNVNKKSPIVTIFTRSTIQSSSTFKLGTSPSSLHYSNSISSTTAVPRKMVELSYITNFENDVTGTLSTLKNDSNNDGDINNNNNNNNNSDDVVVLFLHGLDSSSRTWRGVMQIDDNDDDDSKNYDPITFNKKMKMVALDLRGCGLSPLGNHNDFNIDTVVEDIKYFVDGVLTNIVTKHKLPPKLVLVGHSMGGRIAMHYANKYGDKDVKALVIEDMDVRHRSMKENPVIGKVGRDATLSFDRNNSTRFRTLEGLLDTFAEEGYERESVERWIDDGRIRWISSDDDIDSDSTGERNGNSGGGGYFHSEVNPAFRLLCYETFCDIPNGCEDVWASIATATTNKNNTMKKETTSFPCHLMVAGERKKNSKNPYHGTICDENSVEWMRKIMNGDDDYDNDKDREKPVQTYGGSCSDNSGRGGRLTIRRYPAAGHSIHNSDRRRFMCDLRNIYTEALAS